MYAGVIRSAVHTAFRRGLAIAAVHAAIQPDKDCLREGRKTRPVIVGGFRSALACIRLSLSCPFRLLHTFHLLRPARLYPRVRIWRSSFERQRDFNPPEQRAAQRTLWGCKTAPRSVRASFGRPLVARTSRPISRGGPPGVRGDGKLSSVPGPSLWSMPWARDPGEPARPRDSGRCRILPSARLVTGPSRCTRRSHGNCNLISQVPCRLEMT